MLRFLDFSEPIQKLKLNCDISVPSAVHGYSLAVEYMQKWFLEKFEDGYFKTIYIDGKSVFDDYRKLSKQQLLTIEKPALRIQGVVDWDYNREEVDRYPGGLKQFARRTCTYDNAFYQDYETNNFLGMHMRLLKVNFFFRVRLKTRAQQMDVAEFMKLAFKIGSTNIEKKDMDFHVPKDIMICMAKDAGYEVDENGTVKDVYSFLKHLNSHSGLPFMYKYRTINGTNEFFIRASDLTLHISCLDTLTLDDGERQGQLDNNFHIEMNCELKIPVPQLYVYYTNHTLALEQKKKRDTIGLYNLRNIYEIPKINDKKWSLFLTTDWDNEEKYLDKIEFKELLETPEIMLVLNKTIESGISPSIFIDIALYNNFKKIPIEINWETFEIICKMELDSKTSNIGIYVDLSYVNDQIINLKEMKESRIS